MHSQELASLESRLLDPLPIPIIGQCLQKKAVTALAEDRSPEAVKLLAKAVTRLNEPEIKANILDTLGRLRNQNCIDAVCEVWAGTRHKDLANLLVKKSWVASTPVELRVITALKVSQPQMITNGGKEIVEPLLNAFKDRDSEIANRASEYAVCLTNSRAIDYICQKWARNREKFLEQIVCKGKYVAQQPVELKVLTALKVDKLEVIRESSIEIVEPLFDTISDRNSKIANKAKECISSLTNTDAVDCICDLAIEPNSQRQLAHEVAVRADYAPCDPSRRALFYFLTEQWDKYESLDYEHDLLQKVYELGDEKLRKRIADKARQAGNTAWIQIVAGGRKGQRLGEMTDAEWETTLAILNSGKQWEEMWRLAQKAPAIKSKQLLQQLNKITWFPKAEQEKVSFENLKQLADKCSVQIPKIGGLMSCKKTLTGCYDPVFSPDGKLLASYSETNYDDHYKIRLWEMPDAKPLNGLTGLTDLPGGLAFSPDGKLLVSWEGSSFNPSKRVIIRIWQMPYGKPLAVFSSKARHPIISLSPDGTILACGCFFKGTTELWQMPDGKPLTTLPGCNPAFSPDSKLLANISADLKTIKLWQMPNCQLLNTLSGDSPFPFPFKKVIFSPYGQLIGLKSTEVEVWEMPTCKPLTKFTHHTNLPSNIAFCPDGKSLVSWSSSKAEIKVERIPNGKILATFSSDNNDIKEIFFNSNSKQLANQSQNGEDIRLWRMHNSNPIEAIAVHFGHFTSSFSALRLTLSPDGTILAGGSEHYNPETIRLLSSDLPRLIYIPVAKLNQQNREFIEESLQNKKITEEERHWLEFMQTLMNWHKRFDVEVEDALQLVSNGEFDIEIEG